jgi:hypothetical protein
MCTWVAVGVPPPTQVHNWITWISAGNKAEFIGCLKGYIIIIVKITCGVFPLFLFCDNISIKG